MALLSRHPWCAASLLLVPVLTLAAPGWPRLAGVGPCWAILWLLPWALAEGRLSAILAGATLGLLLDSLHHGGVSEIPALMLLGWWWGRIGRLGAPVERSFSLGLLALLGAALQGVLIWLQLLWWGETNVAALHTLLAQTVLTGLLAPMLCSLQLLFWRQLAPGVKG